MESKVRDHLNRMVDLLCNEEAEEMEQARQQERGPQVLICFFSYHFNLLIIDYCILLTVVLV